MIKIAENFFHKQIVSLKNLEDFEKTDLFLYFEKLFGEMIWVPETDESKHFFISISKTDGMTLDTYPVKEIPAQFLVRERIFYPKGGGTPIGYWYPKCLSHLEGKTFRWDADRQKGYQLSRYGYLIYKLSSEDKKFLEKIKDYEYEGESNDKTKHVRYSSKYSNLEEINEDLIYGKKLLQRALPSCDFLQGMDYYQANLLRYPKGTTISPHNDVDVKSFANIVLSSANGKNKTTVIGELDWHGITMQKLYFGGYDNQDIQDRSLLQRELLRFQPDGNSAIVFNFFNPRFYHEVPPTLEDCYNGLFFGTYRSIMKENDIEW